MVILFIIADPALYDVCTRYLVLYLAGVQLAMVAVGAPTIFFTHGAIQHTIACIVLAPVAVHLLVLHVNQLRVGYGVFPVI